MSCASYSFTAAWRISGENICIAPLEGLDWSKLLATLTVLSTPKNSVGRATPESSGRAVSERKPEHGQRTDERCEQRNNRLLSLGRWFDTSRVLLSTTS